MTKYDVSLFSFRKFSLTSLCCIGLIAGCSDSSKLPPKQKENTSPIAQITLSSSTIKLGQSINISGLESRDPDGDAISYQWHVQHTNGEDFALENNAAVTFDFTPEKFGSYQISLTVSDAVLTSEVVNSTITVEPNAENYPVAIASGDSNNKVGQTHFLSAEKSVAGTEQLLSYQWGFKSQPESSNSTIGDATSSQAYFIADKAGAYEVLLTVTNVENALTAQDNFTVSIDDILTNSPPQAVISTPRVNYGVNEIVNLNGANSYDSDNDQLTYQWRFDNIPATSNTEITGVSAQFIEFLPDVEGDYEVILTVSDEQSSNEQKQVIHVTDENVTPVANAGVDQVVLLGLEVELDGAVSSDADGDTLQYQWSLVSRPQSSNYNDLSTPQLVDASQLSFVPDVLGEYIFALAVHDGNEYSPVDQVQVLVTENQRPVAKLSDDIIVNDTKNVSVFNNGSYDPEGQPLTYSWELIQAPTGFDGELNDYFYITHASFDITLPGTYTVQLIVNDGVQDSIPATSSIVYTPEQWIELTVTGQLVDESSTPLADIEVGGILQAKVQTQSNGHFEVLLKSKEQDARLEYLRFLGDNIPATFLNIPETSDSTLNLGVITLPVLQQLDISLQACQEYTGPTKLQSYFYQLNTGFENMQFPKVTVVELDLDQTSVQVMLPATAEINIRPSTEVKVEFSVEDDLPLFTHHYLQGDSKITPLVIKVCN